MGEEEIKEEKNKEKKRQPTVTLITSKLKGKEVRVTLRSGHRITGKLEKFSLYEIKIGDKIIFKHAIDYIEPIKTEK